MDNITPGPWRVGKLGGCVVAEVEISEAQNGANDEENVRYYGGYLIAESIGKRANANLIAAAPKLLKYAENVMADLEKHGPSIVPHLMDTDENDGEFLRRAIRQAKGEYDE